MRRPALVIVSGSPASGKTTLAGPLARTLGMPLLAKDAIKERIADALGPPAAEYASALGLAAILTLYDAAREIIEAGQPVVLESFFHRGKAEHDLAPLAAISDAVLVHCTAAREVLLGRFVGRTGTPGRHAIHGDAHRADDLRGYLADGTTEPLDLPIPRLTIDTTAAFPDPNDVARQVRHLLQCSHEFSSVQPRA